MNWITTNIRLPEDLYMELKMQAAHERKSVAAVVRDRLAPQKKSQKASATQIMKKLDKLAKEVAKQNKGINFTQGIIDMRYEQ